jgi:hypothetical protein
MASVDERVSQIEGTLGQMNQRLGNVEADLRDMRSETRSNFRWVVGLIIVQWVTVLAAVLGALLAR